MKTSCFDAVLETAAPENSTRSDGVLLLEGKKVPATGLFYRPAVTVPRSSCFVRIQTARPVQCFWGTGFRLIDKADGKGSDGRVLHPSPDKAGGRRAARHLERLRSLNGTEEQMLAALTAERGICGLSETTALGFSGLMRSRLLNLARDLELRGELKILSFHPLNLISSAGYGRLLQRVASLVEDAHRDRPEASGLSPDQIQARTRAFPRAVHLALSHLVKQGRLERMGDRVVPFGFRLKLTPEEEKILKEMEDLSYRGRLQTVSLDELQRRFHLSRAMLEKLLNRLVERRKIVLGKDGFLLHSAWLDQMIALLRDSGYQQLSVADFKRLTGLTRKYAIPLLELLDQLGVTRRVGAVREILESGSRAKS